jgi:hypothetical protein
VDVRTEGSEESAGLSVMGQQPDCANPIMTLVDVPEISRSLCREVRWRHADSEVTISGMMSGGE